MPVPGGGPDTMLIDRFLAAPEFAEHHETEVRAPAARAFTAACEATALELPLLSAAATVRSLPTLARHPLRLAPVLARALPHVASRPMLEQLRLAGFTELGRRDGVEVVIGGIGRLWALTDSVPLEISGPDEFIAFDDRGYAKVALNFAVSEAERGDGSHLVTETRIATTSDEAHLAFRRYWRLAAGPSATIRRGWLAGIRRRAERR